tara:strand:- start:24 stop:674 length:651 start_codon:yes stop_codon:yes gene_type:complete
MPSSIRIAVIDDHRLFSDGFNILLSQSDASYDVSTYDDPVAFLAALSSGAAFDLIVVDLVMRGMNGLALLAAIRSQQKRARVLVLSGITSAAPIAEMRRLGASGFVHKSAETAKLLEAVETILAGKPYFQETGDMALEDPAADDVPWRDGQDLPQLGPRQLEVLTLMGQGATNKIIAEKLQISENTVKSHMRAIFDALDVRTRTACVRRAQLLGFI